jgi:hypothetical protein
MAIEADGRFQDSDLGLRSELEAVLPILLAPGRLDIDPEVEARILIVLSRFWMAIEDIGVGWIHHRVQDLFARNPWILSPDRQIETFVHSGIVARAHGYLGVARDIFIRGLMRLEQWDRDDPRREVRQIELKSHLAPLLMLIAIRLNRGSPSLIKAYMESSRILGDQSELLDSAPQFEAVILRRIVENQLLHAAVEFPEKLHTHRLQFVAQRDFEAADRATRSTDSLSWALSWELTSALVQFSSGDKDRFLSCAHRAVELLDIEPGLTSLGGEYSALVAVATRGAKPWLRPNEVPLISAKIDAFRTDQAGLRRPGIPLNPAGALPCLVAEI